MWVWAIHSSCHRKMRRVENVPWESEKMQKASNEVGKVSNWEAESYRLMEGTQKRRSFPKQLRWKSGSDRWITAGSNQVILTLGWQCKLSPPPPSFRSTPPNDYRCSLHFSQSHRSVSLLRIPSLPPSPLRFLIKTLSTFKCSTTSSWILFVCYSCLPPPPPFYEMWDKKCTFVCNFWALHLSICKYMLTVDV